MTTILVILSLACASLAQVPWNYCPGSGSSQVTVTSTPINPWPIVKGKIVTFQVLGNANTSINQRNARMDIYTASTQIFSAVVGGTYSVSAGSPYNYKFTYTIPSFVPPGSYDCRISMLDQNGNPITCVELTMNF